jgi:hypothetical protein
LYLVIELASSRTHSYSSLSVGTGAVYHVHNEFLSVVSVTAASLL